MSPSNPPPDRFQREIDDIIRLAERRLEKQSFSHRMRRSTRRLGGAMGGFGLRLPPAETLGGLGLAFLMVSWFLTLGLVPIAIALRLQPFFFFQAEDGIRVPLVTGVQTCALPISRPGARPGHAGRRRVPVR